MKRLLLFVLMIMGCCGRFASDAKRCPATPAVAAPVEPLLVRPVLDDVRCRQWVDSVLDKLSLKERIGQLFIYTIAPYQDKANKELLRKVVKDYKVGGLLFSGGLMQNQAMLTNDAAHGGYSSADYVRRGVGAVHALAGYTRLSEEYGAGLHTERQLAL